MSSNYDSPKVILETETGFGGKRLESFELQPNRRDAVDEHDYLWRQAIAVPSRPGALLLDSVGWISGTAFILRAFGILARLAVPIPARLLLALIVFVPAMSVLFLASRHKDVSPHVAYRLFLLTLGAFI